MAADVEALHDLVADHCARAIEPAKAAIELVGLLAAIIADSQGPRHAAELLWAMGDRTIELSPPDERAP